MANWERKSSYLLREIVKFRTYIDSLNAAQTRKDQIYAEREAEIAKDEAANKDLAANTATALDDVDGGASAAAAPLALRIDAEAFPAPPSLP
jgi:hypothetical protein